jgi:DNA-binding XRE family transcriptional regulator
MKKEKINRADQSESIKKEVEINAVASYQNRTAYIRLDALGELIKQLREENELTQSELAELLETNKTYVSKMENNLKVQRLDTIIKVIHALKGQLIIRLPAEADATREFEIV